MFMELHYSCLTFGKKKLEFQVAWYEYSITYVPTAFFPQSDIAEEHLELELLLHFPVPPHLSGMM